MRRVMYYGIKLYLSIKNKKPITPHQNFENLICEKYARSELSFSTGSLGRTRGETEELCHTVGQLSRPRRKS
jgi:hypothetical protein